MTITTYAAVSRVLVEKGYFLTNRPQKLHFSREANKMFAEEDVKRLLKEEKAQFQRDLVKVQKLQYGTVCFVFKTLHQWKTLGLPVSS